MALTDKNILITPNIGAASDPKITFSGADASTAAQNITLTVYPTNGGTLSFDGSAGQLFSVTNSMTGTIFSANDVSGIPSIEVLDTGLVKIAQYSGNVILGSATDTGFAKLQVTGNVRVSAGTTNFIHIGQSIGATPYNSISLNGNNTDSGNMGMTGGGNSDTILYINSTGNITFRTNSQGQTPLTLTSAGASITGAITASGNIIGGYVYGSYFNASAGGSENPTIGQVWTQSTGDNYLRKSTPAHFISQLALLTTSNYTSYSPSLTGGSASGTWGITATSATNVTGTAALLGYSQGGAVSYAGTGGPQVMGDTSNAAMLSFHRSAAYAVNFGLDTDNQLKIGGWSLGGGVSYVMLNSNNYTSYSPTLTGGSASGTWGISVTGTSNNITAYTINQSVGTGDSVTHNDIYANSWLRNNTSGTGLYNSTTTQHWSSTDNGYWEASSTTSVSAIRFFTGGHRTALRGSVYADSSNQIGFLNSSSAWSLKVDNSGNCIATANVTAYSDERVKTNWRVLDKTFIENLAKVKSGIYDRTDCELTQIGVSAQSLQPILPNAVLEDKEGKLSVAYGNAALVSAIELAKEVVSLNARIARLETLVSKLIEG